MKFGLSKAAVAISSPSPGHLKTQRKKLEKLKENTGYGLSGRKNERLPPSSFLIAAELRRSVGGTGVVKVLAKQSPGNVVHLSALANVV
jgi:hypothetical protein